MITATNDANSALDVLNVLIVGTGFSDLYLLDRLRVGLTICAHRSRDAIKVERRVRLKRLQRPQDPLAVMRWSASLGRDLLIGKMGNVRTFTGMLDRDTTNMAIRVHIKQRVFIKIFGLGDLPRTKLNV